MAVFGHLSLRAKDIKIQAQIPRRVSPALGVADGPPSLKYFGSELHAAHPTAGHLPAGGAPTVERYGCDGARIRLVAIVTGVWSPIPFIGLVAAFFAFVPALLAVIFGIVGLRKARTVGVGRGNSVAGIITGGVTLGIIILTTAVWIAAGVATSVSTYTGS